MQRAILILAVLVSLGASFASASDPRRVTATTQDISGGLGPLLDEYRAVTQQLTAKQEQLRQKEAEANRFRVGFGVGTGGLGPGGFNPRPQGPNLPTEMLKKDAQLEADLARLKTDVDELEGRLEKVMDRVLALDPGNAHPALAAQREQVRADKIQLLRQRLKGIIGHGELLPPGCVTEAPGPERRPAGSDE